AYDYALGGSHNFAVDREALRRAREVFPDIDLVARSNRLFLHRAVRFLAGEAGITQFLDLGSGVPTVGNVHEIVQRVNRDCRVVYVDIDPIAVIHSSMLLADDPRATVVQADVRRPESILTSRAVTEFFDLSQPVAVLMVAILHYIGDSDDPAGIVDAFRRATVPGSYLALSHISPDERTEEIEQLEQLEQRSQAARTGIVARRCPDIAALLKGYDLVDPGLVHVPMWRPDGGDGTADPFAAAPERSTLFAAVGCR
ncbi:SAM-dependent methyltransferase, partial [Frankia sp. Cj5]